MPAMFLKRAVRIERSSAALPKNRVGDSPLVRGYPSEVRPCASAEVSIRARTRSNSWPFLTVSQRRAKIATTRPVAIEITGTFLEMSGLTMPVNIACVGTHCCPERETKQESLTGNKGQSSSL